MFTKTKQDADQLLDTINLKLANAHIDTYLEKPLWDELTNNAKAIAKERNYIPGEQIFKEDLDLIKDSVSAMLTDICNEYVELAIEYGKRGAKDALNTLLLVNDQMFAKLAKTLGCPDMPANFGKEIEDKILDLATQAELKITENDYAETTTDLRFTEQRKKNVDKIIGNINSLAEPLKNKEATPLDVAKYAAEYQALKRRQDNHTRVWKFFHKGENKKRTELLAQMKETLKEVLGQETDVDNLTPKELADSHLAGSFKARMEKETDPNGICNRCGFDSSRVGHEPVINEARKKAEEMPAPEQDLAASLEQSLNEGKSNEVSGKVNEEIKPRAIDKGAISN